MNKAIKWIASLFLLLSLGYVLVENLRRKANPENSPNANTLSSGWNSSDKHQPAVLGATQQVHGFTWSSLESTNYYTYIARLRDVGCPTETVVDIILSEVNKTYSARARELKKGFGNSVKAEYWKPVKRSANAISQRVELNRRLATLNTERIEVLRQLLAPDVSEEQLGAVPSDLRIDLANETADLDFLPEIKREQVRLSELVYQGEMKARVKSGRQDSNGLIILKELQAAHEKRLSELLSPEEKLEYDLRKSVTAQDVLHLVSQLDVSESEFRSIFKHRLDFERRTDAEGVAPEVAAEEFDNNFRAVLGQDRYKKYEMVNANDYKYLNSFFKSENLPADRIAELYQVWTAAGDAADTIRLDTSINSENRVAKLREISQQTYAEFERVLQDGPGLEKLRQKGAVFTDRINAPHPRTRSRSSGRAISDGIIIMEPR